MVKELRGLVSGCVGAGLEGDCNIGEGGCLAYACYDGIACFACKDLAGPGGGGCYWNEVMKGQCEVGYWSFSAVTDIAEAHWVVHFADGAIYDDVDDNQNRVRCVR
jgi:hypothetical protein